MASSLFPSLSSVIKDDEDISVPELKRKNMRKSNESDDTDEDSDKDAAADEGKRRREVEDEDDELGEGSSGSTNVVGTPFPCQAPGCIQHFTSYKLYEEHYGDKHRHVCSQCKKILVTEHFLDLHIQECHDSFFKVKSEKQPMFECYLPVCKIKFSTPQERFKHCVDDHKFPKNFKHSTSVKDFYPKDPNTKTKLKRNKNKTKSTPMETDKESAAENSTEVLPQMEVDPTTSSSRSSKMEQLQQAPKSTKNSKKNSNMHIMFGHSAAAARFIPKHTFAMEKSKTSKTVSSQNEGQGDGFNVDELQDALPITEEIQDKMTDA